MVWKAVEGWRGVKQRLFLGSVNTISLSELPFHWRSTHRIVFALYQGPPEFLENPNISLRSPAPSWAPRALEALPAVLNLSTPCSYSFFAKACSVKAQALGHSRASQQNPGKHELVARWAVFSVFQRLARFAFNSQKLSSRHTGCLASTI